jgi:hypothetical protein
VEQTQQGTAAVTTAYQFPSPGSYKRTFIAISKWKLHADACAQRMAKH